MCLQGKKVGPLRTQSPEGPEGPGWQLFKNEDTSGEKRCFQAPGRWTRPLGGRPPPSGAPEGHFTAGWGVQSLSLSHLLSLTSVSVSLFLCPSPLPLPSPNLHLILADSGAGGAVPGPSPAPRGPLVVPQFLPCASRTAARCPALLCSAGRESRSRKWPLPSWARIPALNGHTGLQSGHRNQTQARRWPWEVLVLLLRASGASVP